MYQLVVAALLATGCGSRCAEVARARDALAHPAAVDRGADVRVIVPFARANELVAALLRDHPLATTVDVPAIASVDIPALTATVRDVELQQAGAAGKIRFATHIEIRDAEREVVTFAVVGEVAPRVSRDELAIGIGPENVVALVPELGPDAARSLSEAISRWVPRLPHVMADLVARKLGTHLTGVAYQALQRTLLVRLGEVTHLRLRLPDVPVARVDIASTPTALVVDITTSLPVRRGLAAHAVDTDDISVRLSGSAVAELANWAIDRGLAPRWYNRDLDPRANGEFRPHFDYLAEDRAHPIKVYAFQERGGCSYFRVGVRAEIALAGDTLRATALDRRLEGQAAHPVIEAAAWTQFFVLGSLDRSKRVAAHTRLEVGGRALETRVVGASITADEVRFALQFR